MFVVIDKTYKDSPENPFGLPDDYPLSIKEVPALSIEDVKKEFPDKKVMSLSDYLAYSDGLAHAFDACKKACEVRKAYEYIISAQQEYDKLPWYKRIFSRRPA